ncbi:SDR family NAD(P)-dependent oxidoreductase [Nevskia sp.]|uniref:SDR family NAD(P)-dependent oxidoreductase n=1 Tax=Nevskia sp. TaxID=1929292 RepID=UPI0025E15592|nr:SDR family NAD(P)-dependent oxidoreductase [Nevskia sp.]
MSALADVRGMRFRDRYGPWAVVTGASDGIGAAMAGRLAAEGLHLLLVARRADRLAQLCELLTDMHGIKVRVLPLDLSEPDSITPLAQACEGLDVGLVVAAAGFGSSGAFAASDLGAERQMLAVNCRAVLDLSHWAASRLAARGRGGLILFGSIVGFQGVPGSAHYAATKAWVQTLAEGLNLELKSAQVDVLSSAPGPVHTGFAARAGLQMQQALDAETVAAATLAALGRRMTVAPGWLSKLLHFALTGLPRAIRARIMGRVMSRMIDHGSSAPRAVSNSGR